MSTFFDLYLAWAGSNILAALAGGTTAWWLLARRRPDGAFAPGWQARHMAVAGVGCVLVVLVSVVAASIGWPPPAGARGVLGIVAGVVPPLMMHRRA